MELNAKFFSLNANTPVGGGGGGNGVHGDDGGACGDDSVGGVGVCTVLLIITLRATCCILSPQY